MPSIRFAIRTGDTTWRPPPISKPFQVTAVSAAWDEIAVKVGFRPFSSSLPTLVRGEAFVIDPIDTFFGAFGPAVAIAYSFGIPDRRFAFTQRRVLRDGDPLTFLYQEKQVKVYSTTIQAAPAVVGLPLVRDVQLKPFVFWAPQEYWVAVEALWDVPEQTLLTVANSFG